jgi:glycosyltransferase involved in cell wall biosynthesis
MAEAQTKKRLTIAIPTLNRASLLVRALESALAQTSDEIEILVSDNGSKDDTPAVLARYDDPRLRKVRRETTIPVAQHGTYIFSQVDTEFVLVLSDDDWIEPEFCADVLALWRRHPELSFIYTGCIEHYDDVSVPALAGPEIEKSLAFIAAQAANQRQVAWCACVTRVADLRRFGPQPDDRIIGDMFFWTKIAFLGPVGCVARPLAHYEALRPNGDNESRSTPIIAWAEDTRRLHREILEKVHSHPDRKSVDDFSLRKSLRSYLVGSLANQFVWARISGSSRWRCLKSSWYCFTTTGWRLGSPLPVLAAMILSRRHLRSLVLRNARRLQRQRGAAPARPHA